MFLSIGVWPILMGATQWFQTKFNPPSPDPVQQRMFSLMPMIFTFMLSTMLGGAGDLLDLEQSADSDAAICGDAQAGRESGLARQSEGSADFLKRLAS